MRCFDARLCSRRVGVEGFLRHEDQRLDLVAGLVVLEGLDRVDLPKKGGVCTDCDDLAGEDGVQAVDRAVLAPDPAEQFVAAGGLDGGDGAERRVVIVGDHDVDAVREGLQHVFHAFAAALARVAAVAVARAA